MITLLQRLDRVARSLWPFVLSLLLVIASVLPLQLSDFGRISPNLAVMATFYWAIYRPDLFPAPAAFLLALTDGIPGSLFGRAVATTQCETWDYGLGSSERAQSNYVGRAV